MSNSSSDGRLRIGTLLIAAGICLRAANTLLLRESPSRVALDLVAVLVQSLVTAVVMFVSYYAAAHLFRRTRGSALIDFFVLLGLAIFGRAIGSLLYFLVLRFAPVSSLTFVPPIAQYVIEMVIFARLFSWHLREVLVFAAFVLVGTLVVFAAMGAVAQLMRLA